MNQQVYGVYCLLDGLATHSVSENRSCFLTKIKIKLK